MEIIITQKLIEEYAEYLRMEEKSKNTIDKYVRDIKALYVFIGEKPVSKELALDYKEHLLEANYAGSSINSIIASMNSFFIFIGLEHIKIKVIKEQKQIFCSEERELTKAEYTRLVNTAAHNGNKRLSLIIETICCTGIRVSELRFITVEAVQKSEAIVCCKGKRRSVFIVKDLRKKLLQYAKEESIKTGQIFITRSGKPVSRTNIWRDMKKLCQDAKVNPKKVFPHNLRHLFARVFYGIEKDIAKLADILGHSSINTTRIYIISTGSEHRQRMESMRLVI